MKVWITKYALEDGIIEAEALGTYKIEDDYTKEPEIVYECRDEAGQLYALKEDSICFSLDSAIAKAEEMRKKKIANLKKQIEKLEGMKFE